MSGKPYPEGVREAATILHQLRSAEAEIARQRSIIEGAQLALAQAEKDRAEGEKTLWAKLTSMDLVSSGNYGFENRMTYFLRELVGTGTPTAMPPQSPPPMSDHWGRPPPLQNVPASSYPWAPAVVAQPMPMAPPRGES